MIKNVLLQELEATAFGQPGPASFSNITDVDVVAYKTDIIGDSGLLFPPDWNTPGVQRGKTGELLKPAGWSASVAGIFDNVKMFMHVWATVDVIAEGGATGESLARTAQEVFTMPEACRRGGQGLAHHHPCLVRERRLDLEHGQGRHLVQGQAVHERNACKRKKLYNVLVKYGAGITFRPAALPHLEH